MSKAYKKQTKHNRANNTKAKLKCLLKALPPLSVSLSLFLKRKAKTISSQRMEEDEDMQPFWLQTSNTVSLANRHRRRSQVSSFFLNSGVLLILLLVIVFVFVFIIVPSFLSFTSQIFRPHSIKKGWDSLNLILVLFAIVCGFLSRNNNNNDNNESTSYSRNESISNVQQDVQKSYPSTPHKWYDQYQDRTPAYNNTLSRLRSFSSYPDLRQESLWLANDERWRFYDDTHLHNYRFSSPDDHFHHVPPQQEQEPNKQEKGNVDIKDVSVDTFVMHQKDVTYRPPQSPRPPSPPPPPPAAMAVKRKVKRTHQDLGHEKRTEEKDLEAKNIEIPPPSPPQPPPPPPPAMFSKNEKKRSKDFLTSLRRKKKKQRQKSTENIESLFNPQPSNSLPLIPPPPPPPLPPPHFFQSLFSSKKGKTKKVHSVPPPPAPPPPPSAVTASSALTHVSKIITENMTPPLEAHALGTKAQVAPVTSHKPPKPVKTSSINSVEENVDSGNASPLIPIPPPPPLPPFKMTPWRFVLDGDFVRVGSFNSSRSGSPDLESLDDPSDKESSPVAAKDDGHGGSGDSATMPLFCPSPDVNTKADNFIARFRAGLRLEKVNSVKGRSNLGPEESLPGPEGEAPS